MRLLNILFVVISTITFPFFINHVTDWNIFQLIALVTLGANLALMLTARQLGYILPTVIAAVGTYVIFEADTLQDITSLDIIHWQVIGSSMMLGPIVWLMADTTALYNLGTDRGLWDLAFAIVLGGVWVVVMVFTSLPTMPVIIVSVVGVFGTHFSYLMRELS